MKRLALALTIVGVLAVPAVAEAAPYLSSGEACRTAGRIIHTEYRHVQPGSSRGYCHAQRRPRRPDMRTVDISYRDTAGYWWHTKMSIREWWGGYRYRILSDYEVDV
jgi:hypothetical protein